MLLPNTYPWQAWNTGDTITATDWQNLVDAVNNADLKPMASQFYKDYWLLRNCKDLHTGGGYTGVLSGNTTGSIDTTYSVLNNQGVKCTVNSTATGFYNGFYHSGLSWNLLALNDGSTAASNKIAVVVAFYCSDISKFTNLYIQLGSNSSNYYLYSYGVAGLQNGWNVKSFRLSGMSSTGSPPAMTSISYFSMFTYNSVSGLNSFWIMDHIQLMRVNTADSEAYSMQQSDGDDVVWADDIPRYGYWFLNALDQSATAWGNAGIIRPTSTVTRRVIDLDAQVHRTFYAKVVLACKNAGKTMSILWYVDVDNYIEAYIDGSVLYLSKCVAASVTTKSIALGVTLTKNSQVTFVVWKEGNHFTVKVDTMGVMGFLECSHISTSEGVVSTGMPVAGAISYLYNWVVSHNPALIMETINDGYVE